MYPTKSFHAKTQKVNFAIEFEFSGARQYMTHWNPQNACHKIFYIAIRNKTYRAVNYEE